MTKQEILQHFENALIFYKELKITNNNFNYDFCEYFSYKTDIRKSTINELKKYWIKYRTTSIGNSYHFWDNNERILALEKIIQDLKNELQNY